jgi:hypothetical protein
MPVKKIKLRDMLFKRTLTALLIVFSAIILQAQEARQTFRGRVVDAYTGLPLPGATVLIFDTDPLVGSSTDIDGNFRIDGLSLGRINIKASMMGYQPVIFRNLLLVAGRELVLDIRLEEQVLVLEEVVVRPEVRKDLPVNEMAMVSARSFTIDETERYAGSLGDPSRMAANFAGVSSSSDQRNDIIIRGNSPLGLLWRLEGVEIPNPNHFGSLGTTGGPVSMLNNNLLENSDFYTGAFPAEFGNALAGAFDLRMRNGNNQKHQFMGQVGFNGFELGAEGPLARNSQASFLANFRYSTLEVLHAAGMDFGTGAAIPKYKDFSFKLNIPMDKGRISMFGLGGDNSIAMLESKQDDAHYGFHGTDLYNLNKMGVLGITHLHYFSNNAKLTSTAAVSGIQGSVRIYEIIYQDDIPQFNEILQEVKYTLSGKYSQRFNSRNYLNLGIVYDYYDTHYNGQQYQRSNGLYFQYLNSSGSLTSGRVFAEWRHRFSDEVSLTSGLHASRLMLNNSQALEPRLGFKWDFMPGQSLSLGAGLHSQMQMRAIYFGQRLTDTLAGVYQMTNRHLDFTRSMHFVTGYDLLLGQGHRLKAEAYYQKLYNVPVAWRQPQFSLISQGGAYSFLVFDNMQNSGTAENKGVELTLEKFLHKGFYYLMTASVFDAGYKGYDGIWRNSAFNNNFIFNILGGYEWKLGRRSLLAADIKAVYAGGNRFLPINEEASREANATRYHWDQAFESRLPDYFRLNARITLRMNARRLNQEWAVDLQNITNHQNIFTQNWNSNKKEISTSYQMGFMPMLTYRVYF